MAQRQQAQPPRVSEAEQMLTRRLVSRGYTEDQAHQIIDIVQRLRRGENVNLNSTQSNWINDINAIGRRWDGLSGSTTRLSQLTGQQAYDLASGVRGPERHQVALREEVRPAPVRTFVYDVQVDGRTYVVELNREMPAGGRVTVPRSRMGQLRRMMNEEPSPIVAVRMPDGSTARPGTPEFQPFVQAYIPAYNAMLRDPESDRIVITSGQRTGRREG